MAGYGKIALEPILAVCLTSFVTKMDKCFRRFVSESELNNGRNGASNSDDLGVVCCCLLLLLLMFVVVVVVVVLCCFPIVTFSYSDQHLKYLKQSLGRQMTYM